MILIKSFKWLLSFVLTFATVFGLLQSGAKAATTDNFQVEIDKKNNKLILYRNGEVEETYPVATGRTEDLTPEGTFTMVVKISKPGWKDIPGGDPRNPLGEKWMGLSVNGDKGRTYGIHGTNKPESIGTHASSGCVRMAKDDLIELYNTIPEGTPVWIHKGPSKNKWEGDPSFAVQPMSDKVKVTGDFTNVRTGPSLGAFIIQQEKMGTVLDVIGFVQEWYQVKLANGKIGFVHQGTVQKLSNSQPPSNGSEMTPASGTLQISVDIANIRSTPSLNAPIVMKVKEGTKLTLTGENKEWFQIRLSTGYTAYVHQTVAKKVSSSTPQSQKITVTVNLANIRKAPSQTATIIMRVAKGTQLEKIGMDGEWHIIKLSDGRTGFIHNSVAQ